MIKVLIKNTLQKVAGSLKTRIPTITLPTAPIPVHTAYAVPIGNSFVALTKSNMLIDRQNKNPPYQNHMVVPDVSLAFPRQAANATSNKPAIMSRIQFNLLQFFIILMSVMIAFGF